MLFHSIPMSITTICMECGFSDYRYLNNIYKKQLGYTPIEYRNSHAVTDGYIEKKATDLENMQEFYSREESLKLLKIAETQGIPGLRRFKQSLHAKIVPSYTVTFKGGCGSEH